jgi:hypothetical protein
MSDLFGLIWCALIGLFRPRAALEAEILVLRHQLNVLRRKSPKRLALGNIDRLVFARLNRVAPGILDALKILKPQTVIRWHRAGFRTYWRWKSRTCGGRSSSSGFERWVYGISRSRHGHHGRTDIRRGSSVRSDGIVLTMLLCSANGISAIYSILRKNITMRLGRTYRCTRTRRSRVPSRLSVARWPCQFWADFTTNISGRKFLTGTRATPPGYELAPSYCVIRLFPHGGRTTDVALSIRFGVCTVAGFTIIVEEIAG